MSWEINQFAVTVLRNIDQAGQEGSPFRIVIPQNSQNFARCLKNFVNDSLTVVSERTSRPIYNSLGRQRIIEPIAGKSLEVVA
ncbi:MAG: hypothetical protein V1816_01540 [Pseudomonadota bacterium]